MTTEDVPLVEQYTAKLKARAAQLPDALRDLVLDYVVPILEGQRDEYIGGFEELESQIGDDDNGFRGRVVQAILSIGTVNDAVLKRVGWADENGTPTADCPDDIKIAFGGAQALVKAVITEIEEDQQGEDEDDDDDDGTEAAA